MILIPVDEAAAFDALSIVGVKWARGMGSPEALSVIWKQLENQRINVGEVVNSKEYAALYEANDYCFTAVDMATRDEIPASAVDAANQIRYAAKRALQQRFWPSHPLTEVKSKRPNGLPCSINKPNVPQNGVSGVQP